MFRVLKCVFCVILMGGVIQNSYSTDNSSPKRIAVYAAYDKDQRVDTADLLYLEELKKVADKVIYVCDNYLKPEETDKLKDLCCHVEAVPHGEYDFGSYKRGFQYAKRQGWLDEAFELIFVNDSCWGPFSLFSKIFASMQSRKCDFWGLTSNSGKWSEGLKREFKRLGISHTETIDYHIQSFFLVFRANVFNSEVFQTFIKNIRKLPHKWSVILQYEIGLSQALIKAGYVADCFVPPLHLACSNLTVFPITLMKHDFPLIKKKVFTIPNWSRENIQSVYSEAIRRNPQMIGVLPQPTTAKPLSAKSKRIAKILGKKK